MTYTMIKKKSHQIIFLALLLLCLFALGELSGLRSQISIPMIRSSFESHRLLGGLIFVGLFAIGNLLYVPGWIFLMGAVMAVGKMTAAPLALAGGMASSVLSYYVVGLIGNDALRALDQRSFAKNFFKNLDEKPLRTIIILRLIFQTAPFLNYALILSRVRARDYLLGTLLGLPIPIMLYCLFFEQIIGAI